MAAGGEQRVLFFSVSYTVRMVQVRQAPTAAFTRPRGAVAKPTAVRKDGPTDVLPLERVWPQHLYQNFFFLP